MAPGEGDDPQQYTVQKGDTLGKIAEEQGTTVENLVKWNNIADPNLIQAGASLIVSDAGASEQTTEGAQDMYDLGDYLNFRMTPPPFSPELPGLQLGFNRPEGSDFDLSNDNSENKNDVGKTPWMDYALSQLGQTEMNPGENPAILGYHATTGRFKTDETPWCSSFVNWSVTQAEVKGTNSAKALSWSNWGKTLDKPAYGSIAVIDYGKGKGHVGFVAGVNSEGKIVLLGGNQSDMVKYSAFSPKSISKFVYPSGYTPSYNLPILNIRGASSYCRGP